MLYFENILNSKKNKISDIQFFFKEKEKIINIFPDILESLLRSEMLPLIDILSYDIVIDYENFETNKLCIELDNNNKNNLFLQKINTLSEEADYVKNLDDLSLTSWFLGIPVEMEY
jgi:hypothetical protein